MIRPLHAVAELSPPSEPTLASSRPNESGIRAAQRCPARAAQVLVLATDERSLEPVESALRAASAAVEGRSRGTIGDVLVARDIDAALRCCAVSRPDAILVWGSSASAVVDALRALVHARLELPILVSIAASDLDARLDAFALGAADCLEPTMPLREVSVRTILQALRTIATESVQAELAALEIASLTCPLTGVANRRRLDRTLRSELSRAHRYGTPLTLVFLDLDHFKQINDRFTHLGGDAALCAVAATLETTVRTSDLVARYGGEEFALLLPNTATAGATLLAERLRLAIASLSIETSQGAVRCTASLGVASSHPWEGADHADALVRRADQAVYRAKSRGRNRVVVWSGSLELATGLDAVNR